MKGDEKLQNQWTQKARAGRNCAIQSLQLRKDGRIRLDRQHRFPELDSSEVIALFAITQRYFNNGPLEQTAANETA